MILVGGSLFRGAGPASIAVVESFPKGLRTRYLLLSADSVPEPCSDESLLAEILQRVRDRRLARKKRIFSQDRRPKKTLLERPRAVIAGAEAGFIDTLREGGAATEWVRFGDGMECEKEPVGRALGANYTLALTALWEAAGRVIEEGRLEVSRSISEPIGVQGAVERGVRSGLSGTPKASGAALAVALCLWFREAVPYRRSYRAC